MEFRPKAPHLKYYQNYSNSCFFVSLSYTFIASGENNSARSVVMRIEEWLHFQCKGYKDIIVFYNSIMKYHVRNPGDQRLHYNIKKEIKQCSFDILRDISENITLVQFMETVGNVNDAVIIVGYWIFDFN